MILVIARRVIIRNTRVKKLSRLAVPLFDGDCVSTCYSSFAFIRVGLLGTARGRENGGATKAEQKEEDGGEGIRKIAEARVARPGSARSMEHGDQE